MYAVAGERRKTERGDSCVEKSIYLPATKRIDNYLKINMINTNKVPGHEYLTICRHDDGTVSLYFDVEDERILALGEMNGYDWDTALKNYLAVNAPDLLEGMNTDPEAGTFVVFYDANAENEEKIRRIVDILIEPDKVIKDIKEVKIKDVKKRRGIVKRPERSLWLDFLLTLIFGIFLIAVGRKAPEFPELWILGTVLIGYPTLSAGYLFVRQKRRIRNKDIKSDKKESQDDSFKDQMIKQIDFAYTAMGITFLIINFLKFII